MRKVFFLLSVITFSTYFGADAEKSVTAPIQILEANRQTTKPTRGDLTPFTIYRFRIVWKSKNPPTAFFWRPSANAWMETSLHKPEKRPGLAPGDYMIVDKNIEAKNIRYGDTILITTHHHSHQDEPMPEEVKSQPINSLYYQVKSNLHWIQSPVIVTVLPDRNY